MRNLPLSFDYSTYGQKLAEDFAKFCRLLRIYELYNSMSFNGRGNSTKTTLISMLKVGAMGSNHSKVYGLRFGIPTYIYASKSPSNNHFNVLEFIFDLRRPGE